MAARGPEDTQHRVFEFVQRHGLCRPGERVLLACSGGADSAALLEILWRLSAKLRITIGVVMVDHRQCDDFRKAVRLVRQRCRRRGLPFALVTMEDAHAGLSETEMRRRRYRLLLGAARQGGFERVATGHTRDDQAETVLLRILRGTGAEGLAGIRPRRGLFMRPLLSCSHSELQKYLRRLGLRWWEDPANVSPKVPRNRIRHSVLPRLKREFNPELEQALLRLSLSAGRLWQLARWVARRVRPKLVRGRCEVQRERLMGLPPAARALVIKQMAARVHPEGAGVEQARLEEALRALSHGRERFRIMLGGGRECYGRYRAVVVARQRQRPGSFRYLLPAPGMIELPEAGCRLRLRLLQRLEPRGNERRVYFDADQIMFPLEARSLLPADRIQPWGVDGSRKVARLLMDAKIPREDRWRVPLLLSDGKILWIAGLRRSRLAPVTPATRRVLVVELLPPR